LGARFGGLDVSLFLNNLFDANPLLMTRANHGTYYDPQDWTAGALRPRVIGVTLAYRY
jgi:hypothetical protein